MSVFEDDGAGGENTVWSARTSRPWTIYEGPPLPSRARRRWRVEAATVNGEELEAESRFEIGLCSAGDWSAHWISAPELPYRRESWDPSPYLRREFVLEEDRISTTSGRVYASALGLYRLWLNGVELTHEAHLRPGWTDYRTRLYHQTFDCTSALRPGVNVLTAVLAGGWYAGRIGMQREPRYYGPRPALLAQLELDGTSGGRSTIASGEDWQAAYGSVLASDLLEGEVRDLRQEPIDWREPGFDASTWKSAVVLEKTVAAAIEPQPHDSIATFQVHEGKLVHEHAVGPAVYDFGQNLVGWTRVNAAVPPTVELIVRHGEILTPDKRLYRDNLRRASQEDRYTARDAEPHTFEPMFGYHGFRFAEIWGATSVDPDDGFAEDATVEAVSVTGLRREVGSFACSHAGLTKLAQNIGWTVRANFLEAITDCPQRDERLGYLGDAAVIAPTAAYFFDISAMVAKFLRDVADAQQKDGSVPNIVPVVRSSEHLAGAPGWADGYVGLAHLLVERYGDLATADRLFDSLCAFVNYFDRENPDGLRTRAIGPDFGDWASLPGVGEVNQGPGYVVAEAEAYSTTPRPLVDTAHSYRSFLQVAEIAARLGRTEEADRCNRRAEQIRRAYIEAFVLEDGSILGGTQTAYAQAIDLGLLRGEQATTAAAHLRALVEERGHVTTGIHGVGHILQALCDNGMDDTAMDLLLHREMPGWLYMVDQGATTVWEKWDAIRPDGGLTTSLMNSMNHCAFGAVGRFLFERLAGIDASETTWTGEVRLAARYTRDLDWVRASYKAPHGPISSEWHWDGGKVIHELEIPGAAAATFDPTEGWSAEAVDGARFSEQAIRLGPGHHKLIVCPLRRDR